jgi:hypothetical protein
MKEFLKERIALFLLLLASDSISLLALIKANELKADALTLAIAISIIPSLLISVLIKYFFIPRVEKKTFVLMASAITVLLWIGFIITYRQFSHVNNQYGKMAYAKNKSELKPIDSFIVAGCHYTSEAQAEVDDFRNNHQTLTPRQLFADFNYDVSQIWTEDEINCASEKILSWFAVMFSFLIAGVTLTCELFINGMSPQEQLPQKTAMPG